MTVPDRPEPVSALVAGDRPVPAGLVAADVATAPGVAGLDEPAVVTGGRGAVSQSRRPWFPVAVFGLVLVVLLVTVWQAHTRLPDSGEADSHPAVHHEAVLGGWLWFDASWYADIAAHGYSDQQVAAFRAGEQSSVAFFPAYPLTVRGLADLTGLPVAEAAMLTTALCGLLAAVLFWTWLGRYFDERARRLAVLALFLYPYAWFLYASGYADALFLAAVLAACVLLDRDRPVAAGLVGIVVAAARPAGLPAVVGLLAIAAEHRGIIGRDRTPVGSRADFGGGLTGAWRAERARWHADRSRVRAKDAGVLLSLLGAVAWLGWLYHRTGDAVAFATVQAAPGWNQGAGPSTWLKRGFFGHLLHDHSTFTLRLVVQAALCVVFIGLVPWVARRFGWGYGCYVLLVVGIPALGVSDFQGMARYVLAAFPVFALAGEACARRPTLSRSLVPASALSLLVLTALFAQGRYLT